VTVTVTVTVTVRLKAHFLHTALLRLYS